MALLAYLMQHKGVSGPHLIIVPNAVIVNWKAELLQWLPAMRCVWYVGGREERARKFTAEVASIQFNVLVTTYEFIMRDRARLSKVRPGPLSVAGWVGGCQLPAFRWTVGLCACAHACVVGPRFAMVSPSGPLFLPCARVPNV